MKLRGFNLLEVAVASAMAGIIAVAAISSFALLNRQLVKLRSESEASDQAKTLVDFLVTELQSVGGGSVRPWMALWVEDGQDAAADARCPNFAQSTCGDSDRLTYAVLIPRAQPCKIVTMTNTTITSEGTGSGCCWAQLLNAGGFEDPPAAPGDPLPSVDQLKAHVVVVKGSANRQIAISQLDSATCTANYLAGPLAGIDNKDGDDLVAPNDPGEAGVAMSTFQEGSASAVVVRTIFLDEARNELFAFDERRGFNGANITMSGDEKIRLAGGIFDLQLQLGYDGNPADGRLDDSGNTTDEWLYNAGGPDALPAGVSINNLRMAAVGAVVGVKVKDSAYKSGAQVIGGTFKDRAGFHMRPGMGKAALRNVFIFN